MWQSCHCTLCLSDQNAYIHPHGFISRVPWKEPFWQEPFRGVNRQSTVLKIKLYMHVLCREWIPFTCAK